MTIEHRTFHNVEVRAGDTGPNGRPTVTLQAIKPYVVDDYGSVWMPDTFDTDVQGRMAADPDDTPALCWDASSARMASMSSPWTSSMSRSRSAARSAPGWL